MMRIVLVVDDSRVVRKIARRILEGLGFEVAEAADGAEALAFCAAAMPDAVLVDWVMPSMDGLDFVKRLRAEPSGDSPLVLFCSSETAPGQIAAALDAGADEYIMKPFDGDIIEAKLHQVGLLVEAA